MVEYHYNLSGELVWASHIAIGLVIAYVGYLITNKKPVNKNLATTLQIIGVLAALYHLHIWYDHKKH
jgi:hypothetical protein